MIIMVVIYGRALLSEADSGPRTQAEAIHEGVLLGAEDLLPLYLYCFAGNVVVNSASSSKNHQSPGPQFSHLQKGSMSRRVSSRIALPLLILPSEQETHNVLKKFSRRRRSQLNCNQMTDPIITMTYWLPGTMLGILEYFCFK